MKKVSLKENIQEKNFNNLNQNSVFVMVSLKYQKMEILNVIHVTANFTVTLQKQKMYLH